MTTPRAPQTPSFDPGLTQQYTGALLRAINKDGTFNVKRRGITRFAESVYTQLVSISWPRFLGLSLLLYLAVNTVFGLIYLMIGPDVLHASERDSGLSDFARAFFFSSQTLTTVGYGSVFPSGLAANLVASIECAFGLAAFAVVTGLIFARFSRPSAKLIFSNRLIVAPYREGTSLQFRIANQRSHVLTELEADMLLMTVETDAGGQPKRNFAELALERRSIFFLALTWTIVHPIT